MEVRLGLALPGTWLGAVANAAAHHRKPCNAWVAYASAGGRWNGGVQCQGMHPALGSRGVWCSRQAVLGVLFVQTF
jgi:hypothetical protein